MSSSAAAGSDPRDFLLRLEAYLARRDGVDKLLKILRYASRLALSSPNGLPLPLAPRLRAFESSVGLSRKAFRLGKFVQDLNALRLLPSPVPFLPLLAYSGEGAYYFLEQFVWLAKAGLLPRHFLPTLQLLSAWAELAGYAGSIAVKLGEERRLRESLEALEGAGDGEGERRRRLKEKLAMKRLSIVQDLADALMALADVRGGAGRMTGPALMASAGLLSALISAHKNWKAC